MINYHIKLSALSILRMSFQHPIAMLKRPESLQSDKEVRRCHCFLTDFLYTVQVGSSFFHKRTSMFKLV